MQLFGKKEAERQSIETYLLFNEIRIESEVKMVTVIKVGLDMKCDEDQMGKRQGFNDVWIGFFGWTLWS